MTIHFNGISDKADRLSSGVADAALTRKRDWYWSFGKRALDLLLVGLAAPIVVPVVLVLALMVALEGGRPFYTQSRVGRGNRAFRIFKLRTMVVDAEARLARHLEIDAEAKAEWDAHQKLVDDPRITRVGRFLRRTSLDELPQLWNVVIGDMSLVGPRPMMLEQRAMYPGSAYYSLRPGITGPWQVSDRNAVEFRSRAVFDQRYFHDVSLLTDLRLLVQTVRAVLRCTGH
jgi:lipopolysaccharide/colanic/teichoic acid biosynthesis glycosyltransferase